MSRTPFYSVSAFVLLIATISSTKTAVHAATGNMEPMRNLHFSWTTSATHIRVTLTAIGITSADDSYLAFGIGEPSSGSMPGSDIAIASFSPTTGALVVGDYFATGLATPHRDCNNVSDWVGVSSERTATTTTVVLERRLNVTDIYEDRAIVDDGAVTRLIFATGPMLPSSDPEAVEGRMPMYHGTSRVMTPAVLFHERYPMAEILADPTILRKVWAMENYEIPTQETTYAYSRCFLASELPVPPGGAKGREPKLLGTRMVTLNHTKPFIHHWIALAYSGTTCGTFGDAIGGSASAMEAIVYPRGVGLPIGEFKSFNLQIHYDNPNGISGVIDNTGMEMFVTYEDLKHHAGIVSFGDPIVMSQTPIENGGLTTNVYRCPGECTSIWKQPITVFNELLHMHTSGEFMETVFIDPKSDVPRRVHNAEYYSFHGQQQMNIQPFVLHPGADVTTTCRYKNARGSRIRFGLGSRDEMCLHTITYYPRDKSVRSCGLGFCGSIESSSFATESAMARAHPKLFGAACGTRGGSGVGVSGAASVAGMGAIAIALLLLQLL